MEIPFNAKAVEAHRIRRAACLGVLFLASASLLWWIGTPTAALVFALGGVFTVIGACLLIWRSRQAGNKLVIENGVAQFPMSLTATTGSFDLSRITNWNSTQIAGTESLVAVNDKSIVSLSQRWFSDRDWQTVLRSVEQQAGPQQKLANPPVHVFWIGLIIGIIVIHYIAAAPVGTGDADRIFTWLRDGGANWNLITAGEPWRLLSANLLHANFLHLFVNVIGLLYLASQCGNQFRTIDYTGLAASVGIISMLGTVLVPIVTAAIGASGLVYGLYGFLYGAQQSADQRLHPLFRAHTNGGLLAVLLVELIIGVMVTSYGAIIHLFGLATGYMYYRVFVKPRNSRSQPWRRLGQVAVTCLAVLLTADFVQTRLKHTHSDNTKLALRLIDHDNFRLTTIGGLVLADQPDVTDAEIERLLRRINDHRSKGEIMDRVKARALHWQGETTQPIRMMRKWMDLNPTDEGAQNFLALLEREAAERKPAGLGELYERLQAGTGTAVLLNHTFDRIALIPLTGRIQVIGQVLPKHRFDRWYLLTVYPKSRMNTRSWFLERTQYPTRSNGSSRK